MRFRPGFPAAGSNIRTRARQVAFIPVRRGNVSPDHGAQFAPSMFRWTAEVGGGCVGRLGKCEAVDPVSERRGGWVCDSGPYLFAEKELLASELEFQQNQTLARNLEWSPISRWRIAGGTACRQRLSNDFPDFQRKFDFDEIRVR